ncbi:hypothetical protein ACFL2V_11205 [Pseudomonadota bacterium]
MPKASTDKLQLLLEHTPHGTEVFTYYPGEEVDMLGESAEGPQEIIAVEISERQQKICAALRALDGEELLEDGIGRIMSLVAQAVRKHALESK